MKYNPLSWFLFVYFINTIIGGYIFWISAPHEGVYSLISGTQYSAVTFLSIVAILPFYLSRKVYSLKLDPDIQFNNWRDQNWLTVIVLFRTAALLYIIERTSFERLLSGPLYRALL